MSTYTELKGLKVKYLAADPDPGTAGDVWYNSVEYKLKGFVGRSAWSSIAPLSTARADSAGAGSTPAGLAFGGTPAATEEYNGSGWVAGEDMGTARRALGGTGTQTAGLAIGGYVSGPAAVGNVEEYDGTDWSEQNDIPTALWKVGAAGVQTAALSMGGKVVTPEDEVNSTYEYDGASWTTGGNLGTARYGATGGGTQTAGMAAGGFIVPNTTSSAVELYDGSAWTATTSLTTARNGDGNQGGGTSQTNVLVFGGTNPSSGKTESWDGNSWTEVGDMATNTNRFAGAAASSSSGFAAGGAPTSPTAKAYAEEYNLSFEVVTAGAWASGGNINSQRYQMGGCGTLTAGLAFGGYEPGGESGKTEEYDGSSWTESGDLGTARYVMANGSGTQTAALCVAGRTDAAGAVSVVEEYNGSTWSEVTNVPGTRVAHGSAGPQTAALVGLGSTAPGGGNTTTTSFHYDGTNWTSGGTANTARNAVTGTGTQTAAIFAGGSPKLTNAEEYDGSSWTAGGSMLFGAHGASASGTQTAALYASGGDGASTPSATTETQLYNGSVFATQPTLASTRGYAAGFGISTSSVVGGGLRTAGVATTEEFTGETSAETGSTIDFD